MASNMQKPDGLVILPIEKLPGAILHLKLRDIPGIGPKMAEHLRRSGITDIATLWNTDAAQASADLGRRGRRQDARTSAWGRYRKPEDRALEHQPPACSGARRQKH